MEHATASGPASLRRTCERVIFRHRDWLGDIGHMPVDLLEDCLHACSARQLARIDDETSEGGVDISAELAHHWKRCFEQRFGSFNASKEEAPLLEAASESPNSNGHVVDWRALYEQREEQYEAKLRASGERLRQMTAAESSGRDVRGIQVVKALEKRPPGQRSFSRSFTRSAGPNQAIASRHRLLRKLGMGTSAGSSGQAPGRRIRTIWIAQGAPILPAHDKTGASTCNSGSQGSAGLRLSDCELDLKPSSRAFIPRPQGTLRQPGAAGSEASSGSDALHLKDNRFISQPPFDPAWRAAPKKHLAPLAKQQLQQSSAKGNLSPEPPKVPASARKRGLPPRATEARKQTKATRTTDSEQIQALPLQSGSRLSNGKRMQSRQPGGTSSCGAGPLGTAGARAAAVPPSSKHGSAKKPGSSAVAQCAPGQKGRPDAPGSLSRGVKQVSPQPRQLKQSTASASKSQGQCAGGAAGQPAKRVKYDHLLGGNALLSIASRRGKK